MSNKYTLTCTDRHIRKRLCPFQPVQGFPTCPLGWRCPGVQSLTLCATESAWGIPWGGLWGGPGGVPGSHPGWPCARPESCRCALSRWPLGSSRTDHQPLFGLQVVKWSDCCLPLACLPGHPYQLFARASVDDFSKLGVAFMEDRLHLANGLVPQKIVCK